jgi:endonuclease I
MIKNNIILFIMVNLAFTLKSLIIVGNTTPTIYSAVKNSRLSLEHIYPKCYMYKKHYNDAHNIFKCDAYINNMRSNYKFVEDYNNTFVRLYNTDNFVNTKSKLFIPEDGSKGIIARSIMHMCYEYKYDYKKVIDYKNLIGWCLDYPPTKEEIHHNNYIFQHQKTRNMFIDLYHKKKFKNLLVQYFS